MPSPTRLIAAMFPKGDVAALARHLVPDDVEDLESSPLESSGPLKLYKGHLIKRSDFSKSDQEAHGIPDAKGAASNEDFVSRLFQATKTPGAIYSRRVDHPTNGHTYTVSRHLGEGVTDLGGSLKNGNRFFELPHQHIADVLLSEHLAGVRDRHGGNYLVSPSGLHSIDHEAINDKHSKRDSRGPLNGAVWNAHLAPNHLVASADHVNRWKQVIGHTYFQKHPLAKLISERFNKLPVAPDGTVRLRDIE